jgi:hypothetical protein
MSTRAAACRGKKGMLLCVLGTLAVAPRAQTPTLHTRLAHPAEPAQTAATGQTDMPPAAEGEYPWGKPGEEIELYFEHGRLQGYMTQRADAANDRSAPVTFDFATTHASGHTLAWTTRVVHGVAYSFAGSLDRGSTSSPRAPGLYILIGTLTTHGGPLDGTQRLLRLKREPGSD